MVDESWNKELCNRPKCIFAVFYGVFCLFVFVHVVYLVLVSSSSSSSSSSSEPRFLIAWSGKPSKNLSDEFKAFRTNLFVWLKRNTPNDDVRRNQSFQELIKCIPVSLTTQCPTQAEVKELAVGGSAKNLCQMWRQKQKKLENFRKSPPTESECKKAIQDNAGWGRMTANSLLKLWEPRCSRRGQPNLPAKDLSI